MTHPHFYITSANGDGSGKYGENGIRYDRCYANRSMNITLLCRVPVVQEPCSAFWVDYKVVINVSHARVN